MLKALVIASILVFATQGCSPFVGGKPIVTASAAGCSGLLPPEWKQGVEGADLPVGDDVGDWVSFADAQTGRLDIANDRTKSAIGIVERCEARDAKAVKQATKRKFLGIF